MSQVTNVKMQQEEMETRKWQIQTTNATAIISFRENKGFAKENGCQPRWQCEIQIKGQNDLSTYFQSYIKSLVASES